MKNEESMKVNENLSHLTEYERYLWLMRRYPGRAGKEYNYSRDGDYHYYRIGNIWFFILMFLIPMLVCIPVAPFVGIPGAIIVLVIGFMALTTDRRVDPFKRRKFFEENGVPNFEEYDDIPLPEKLTLDRLRYIVHKFKSEKGYEMWENHVRTTRRYSTRRTEEFARIE